MEVSTPHNGCVTTTAESQALLGQLLDPSNRPDPYPLYRRFLEHGPLRMPEANLTVLSSYRDCDDVLRHPSSASDRNKSAVAQRQIAAGEQPRPYGHVGLIDKRLTPAFLFLDPPEHTRLRKLVSKALTPKVFKDLEPFIRAVVDSLIDEIAEKGHVDIVEDFAYPLPVAVICRLLGLPAEDEPEFRRASGLIGQALDPFIGQLPEELKERSRAGKWLRGYHRELIKQRRRNPGDDLMSALVHVEESGEQLTEEEIISTCNLLLVAGHESTAILVSNAILAMMRNPDQWAALAANRRRGLAVVEETLRYDPPVQLLGRIAGDDMTIGDTTIPMGDTMILVLAAAQRDPAANDHPDKFDSSRKAIRHLGFGHGTHFCLGAPLGRLEGAVALSAFAARFPQAQLDGEPQYKPNLTLRGMSALPVKVWGSAPGL
jgi:cytochrome P450